MLVPTDVFNSYSWIGIDPGLTKCGISIFKIDKGQLVSIDALTLVNNKIILESEYQLEYHTERQIRMNKLCLAYAGILAQVNPILVCCESPFYNPKMPGAFGSLTETCTALRFKTNEFNPIIPFIFYSPQEVKHSFRVSGKLGKLIMREALAENKELSSKLTTPIDLLDEHAIDAIAVGFSYIFNHAVWST